MRRYVGVVVLALLAGGICFFFGLPILYSIIVVLVAAAAAIAVRAIVGPLANHEWPPPPPKRADGERHEVSQLGWAISSRGVVEDRVIERVQRVASSTLARRQLDLADPADRTRIERLVGPQTYQLLTAPEAPRIGVPALLDVLGRLESLEKSDPAARN